MEDFLNLEKNSALLNAPEINSICDVLNEFFDITYFNHIRQFSDNTRICLTNHGDWVKHVCQEKLYLIAPFEESKIKHQPGYVLWGAFKDNLVYQNAFQYFQIDHGITIIEKCDTHIDFYHFGTPVHLNLNSEYFIHILDALKAFILYYKEKAHKLIVTSNILDFPELRTIVETTKKPESTQIPSQKKKQEFLDALKIQRFYLGGEFENQYLTSRELECVRWLVLGKSAEEIAMIMGITPRTSITHINNVKEKFGCVKVSQLVFKLARSNSLDLVIAQERV